MEYRKQHVVSQAFLRAWADPRTPEGYEPYVWQISRDGAVKERKSPKSILHETDFYTVIDRGGGRNIDLEKRLSQIESKFIDIREKKLVKNLSLTEAERSDLAPFIASSYARTNYNKDAQSAIWREYEMFLSSMNIDITGSELAGQKSKICMSSQCHSLS